MSYLSTALTRLAERAQMRQADVARESGLTRSHVSRVFSADQGIADQDFIALLRAFRRDPRMQSELVAARCMDARVGPGADAVEITIKDRAATQPERKAEFPDVQLSERTERAIAWLRRQCPVNPDLENHLVGFARMLGME